MAAMLAAIAGRAPCPLRKPATMRPSTPAGATTLPSPRGIHACDQPHGLPRNDHKYCGGVAAPTTNRQMQTHPQRGCAATRQPWGSTMPTCATMPTNRDGRAEESAASAYPSAAGCADVLARTGKQCRGATYPCRPYPEAVQATRPVPFHLEERIRRTAQHRLRYRSVAYKSPYYELAEATTGPCVMGW